MKYRLVAALLAAVLALGVLPSVASASDEGTARAEEAFKTVVAQTDGLAELLNDSAADLTAYTVDETGKSDTVMSMGAEGSDMLSIPADPTDPISMTRSGGANVGVSLPGTPSHGKAAGTGMVLFEGVAKDTDVLIQPQKDTGVRVLTVINGPQAPTQFDYDLKLADGHKLFQMQDGRVVVVDAEDFAVALIEAPWAYDAQGNAVPVSYTTSDTVLTLNVAHDDTTAYPVLADPVFTWGIISGTAYFNRSETYTVGTFSLIPIAVFLVLPEPITSLIAAQAGVIVGWAASAIARDRTCLKLRYGFSPSWNGLNPFLSPGHYRDEAGVRCN